MFFSRSESVSKKQSYNKKGETKMYSKNDEMKINILKIISKNDVPADLENICLDIVLSDLDCLLAGEIKKMMRAK